MPHCLTLYCSLFYSHGKSCIKLVMKNITSQESTIKTNSSKAFARSWLLTKILLFMAGVGTDRIRLKESKKQHATVFSESHMILPCFSLVMSHLGSQNKLWFIFRIKDTFMFLFMEPAHTLFLFSEHISRSSIYYLKQNWRLNGLTLSPET